MTVRLRAIEEQTVVIAGASSGIGLATAEEAVRRGAQVVIASRNAAALEEIAQRLRGGGGQVAICVADVGREADVERIAATAEEAFGGFDTWVNCASVTIYGEMAELAFEEHRRVIDVNYFGLLKGSLLAIRHLRKRGGALINLGSILSDRAIIMQGPYCAAKHAVRAATEALRMETERRGDPVSITLIKPGAIHTPFPEHARNYMALPPRLPQIVYDPRLVADAILFAAEHPRRQLYVGGHGLLISLFGRLFPRLTDWGMEMLMVRGQETRTKTSDPAMRDNLFEPRRDGVIDSNQEMPVRGRSWTLEAQKHPLAAAAIVSAAGALAAWAASQVGNRRRAILQAQPL